MTPGEKKILDDTKGDASVAADIDDEDNERYEEEVSYFWSYH